MRRPLLLLALTLAANDVHAAGFAGATVGDTSFPRYRDASGTSLGRAVGYDVFAEHVFEHLPLMLEFDYLDAGARDILNPGGDEIGYLEFKGVRGAVGWIPWSGMLLDQPLVPWLKAGYYYGETLAFVESIDTAVKPGAGFKTKLAEQASGPSLALGADWMLGSWIGVRLNYGALFGMRDYSGADHRGRSTETFLGLGVVFAF